MREFGGATGGQLGSIRLVAKNIGIECSNIEVYVRTQESMIDIEARYMALP
jgi:hypothetical protein